MGTFRSLDAPAAKPQGGTYRNMDVASKRSVLDDVGGALASALRVIPFADEVNDAAYAKLKTGVDLFQGRGKRAGENPVDYGNRVERENYAAARVRSKNVSDDFGDAHPVVKPLVEFGTMAAPIVATAMTGGAAAPSLAAPAMEAVAAPGKGLMGALRNSAAGKKLASASLALSKAAATGGLLGALTGFADDGDLDERLEAANQGAGTGAVVGAAALPLMAGGVGAVNAVRRAVAPAAEKAAAQAGRVVAGRAPGALDPAPADGLSLPFERMGPGGETVARAVASVPGPGQDIARSALTERRQGARGRIVATLRRDLGDDGSNFHDMKTALDKRRLDESRPLYQDAFGVEPPVTDALERLKGRPSIRQAMRRGAQIAAEEGENPNALGLFHMEDQAGWASEAPPTERVMAEASRVAGSRGPAAPKRGPSLAKFVADNGGVRDTGGDVNAMGGREWHRGKAYQRGLEGEGGTPDDWALRAWEAGYFPEHQTRPTVNDFLDALGDDVAGRRRRFAREADPRAVDRNEHADQADEMAYRGGPADHVPHPDDYLGRPEPQTGPVYGEAPTFKAWDYVKRGLDDLIESRRDPVTGKLERSDEVRGWENTRRELRGHLTDINPTYGQALKAYTGPSRQMSAMDLGRRMVTGRADPEALAEGIDRMGADEVDAMRLGLSRGLSDVFRERNPQVAFRAFMDNDVLQDRLRHGFGDDQAYGRFMNDVAKEFEANLSYNRVLTGSRTTPLAEDISAVNRAADEGGVAEHALRMAGDSRPIKRQVFDWAVTKLRQAKESTSGLNNPEVSRLLGNALFRNGDPAELLDAMVRQRVISPDELARIMPYLAGGAGAQAEHANR